MLRKVGEEKMNKRRSDIQKRIVKEVGRCELCGSKRGLEAHHIVPVVCGGEDVDENLICVCSACHARLTPRAYLCKIGKEKKRYNHPFKQALYAKIEENLNNGNCDVFDAIEAL
jgi:5-methylcytosine-specific restriction endonuclease McrA